ncbi:MAG: DUF2029 domain-containing protein [Acidimicrobiia bacterium]|nr:DUF2029 domain-containing protein [Acidimicrobiia bacterium]
MSERIPWVIALMGILGFALFAAATGPGLTRGAPDFPNYYYPAVSLAEGNSPYLPIDEALAADFGPDAAGDVQYAADPPSALLALSWLSTLSYAGGWWALAGLATASFWVAIYLSGRTVGLSRSWSAALAGAGLLSTSYRFHFFRNHFESVVMLLGVLGWVALRKDKPGWSGVSWALAGALKAFPGLWVVTAMRRGRLIAAAAATIVAIGGLTVAVVGWSDVQKFFVDVIPLSQQWYGARGNYSLLSAGYGFGSPAIGWGLLAVGLVVYAWSTTSFNWSADGIFAQGVVWSLLLSPLNWLNYLIIAFPVLILIGSRIEWSRRAHRWLMAFAVVGVALWQPVPARFGTAAHVTDLVPTLALLGLAAALPGLFAHRSRPA